MKKIGVIGLGIMGTGIASNFLKNKFPVFVWNRTVEKSQALVREGAIVCGSPQEVARSVDIIFEVTASDKSSKQVWLGPKGILRGSDKNKILVTSATLSIGWVDTLIRICKEQGFVFFDMAMTGGRVAAEGGTLTLLCGGNEEILTKIKPDLQAIAAKVVYFGPEGHGMRYKLILNFMQALHMVGFGQALKLSKALGLDEKKVGNALVDRPGGVITEIAWRDYQKTPDPITFSIEWITKDLTYAKKISKNLNIRFINDVLAAYKKAVKRGHAKKDWAEINTLEI